MSVTELTSSLMTTFAPYTQMEVRFVCLFFLCLDSKAVACHFIRSDIPRLHAHEWLQVSIPMEKAGYCLATVGAQIYGSDALWQGFRNVALVRFVSGEPFYLSNTNGGPRMYINLEVSHRLQK